MCTLCHLYMLHAAILRMTIAMAELVVNLFATLVSEFVGDAWNWFDFVVVGVSLVSLVHSIPHLSIILHPSFLTHYPSPVPPRGLFPGAFIPKERGEDEGLHQIQLLVCASSSSSFLMYSHVRWNTRNLLRRQSQPTYNRCFRTFRVQISYDL